MYLELRRRPGFLLLVVLLLGMVIMSMVPAAVSAQAPVREQGEIPPVDVPEEVEQSVLIEAVEVSGYFEIVLWDIPNRISLEEAVHYNDLGVHVYGNSEYGAGPVITACGRFDVDVDAYQTVAGRADIVIRVWPVDYDRPLVVFHQNMGEIVWDLDTGVVTAMSAFVDDFNEPAGLYIQYPAGYLELGETKTVYVEVDGRVFEVRVTRVECPEDPNGEIKTRLYLPFVCE